METPYKQVTITALILKTYSREGLEIEKRDFITFSSLGDCDCHTPCKISIEDMSNSYCVYLIFGNPFHISYQWYSKLQVCWFLMFWTYEHTKFPNFGNEISIEKIFITLIFKLFVMFNSLSILQYFVTGNEILHNYVELAHM